MREVERRGRDIARERAKQPDPVFERLRAMARHNEACARQQGEMAKARREAMDAAPGPDGSWSLPPAGGRGEN